MKSIVDCSAADFISFGALLNKINLAVRNPQGIFLLFELHCHFSIR